MPEWERSVVGLFERLIGVTANKGILLDPNRRFWQCAECGTRYEALDAAREHQRWERSVALT